MYYRYGGRGIECRLTAIQTVTLWDRDGGAGMRRPTLDRKDSDGHYEFDNCRFIEKKHNTSAPRVQGWTKDRERGS